MARLRSIAMSGAAGDVLEIGCGTGLGFEYVPWQSVRTYVATDPDEFMLRRARKRVARLPREAQSKLRIEEAAAESLPVADASIDVVISALVFCTVKDVSRALSEVSRVLRPGGQLRLIEHVAGHGLTAALQKAVQPVYGWMAADCQLRRETEGAVEASEFELEVLERFSLGPILPGFVGVATKRE